MKVKSDHHSYFSNFHTFFCKLDRVEGAVWEKITDKCMEN